MIVWGLIVMTTMLQMDSGEADSVHGPGYVGCYSNSHHALTVWRRELTNDENVTNVDECVDRCTRMNKPLAVIAIRSCYCSDGPPNISKAIGSNCNVKCDSNPCQICGSRRYYSVYNTTERLQSSCSSSKLSLHVVSGQPILNCSTCCRKDVSTCRSDIQINNITLPQDIHSCISTRENGTLAQNSQDPGNKQDGCWCQPIWLRIVIDVAVILGVLFLVLIIFLTVRCFRNRRRGMFDEWKPRSFGQTGHLASRSPGNRGDLLNRNHSYRNLSGSSTLDRGLESLDQAMAASGGSAVIQSLDDDRRSRYGSLPALAKKESVSTANPRAVTLNSRKLTGVPLDSTPSDSVEGYYHETEFLTPPDHLRNQHVLPEPKNKPRHSSKTSQKECPKDGTEEKDAVLDKPKRRSLLNFLSKDSGKPSFQEPSKDDGASPKDPGSFMEKTWGSRHGNKGKKKTEAADKRNSSSISEDEKVFEHPKSKTLPNDIYAVPNKPGKRNKERKERPNSDATEGAKSGDVEHQEGYSRLSRLFKPRARGSSKPRGADDTAPSNEYSALQPDSKDTDYDKLGKQGDTDRPFDRDKNNVSENPAAETYASMNDTEYAAVGEETPGAPQSTDYEMIACGQKGQK